MDWTIFWTIFWAIFWTFYFWTILEGGVEHTIITEGGMKSISSEGGVGGRVLLLREGCETDYYYKGRGGRWL